MSENTHDKKKKAKTHKSEEIDLVVFFNLIGNFFLKIIDFFKSIFQSIISFFVFILRAFINNLKIISIVVLVSAAIGYGLEKIKPNIYVSSMFVKPYFDSKYQLVNNIKYFNGLLENGEYQAFSEIFDIEEEEARKVLSFDIGIGPESENDKVKEYDEYLKSLDSVRAQEISYSDFIENRNIFSSNFFEISVESMKKDIFKKLENGLNSSFENTYSEKKMKKRDSLIYIQKQNILASIGSVDSLQKVYIRVLEEESKSKSQKIGIGEGFTIEPAESKTREFELLNKELDLRKQLRVLDEQKVEEDVFFDTVSGFQEIGSISKNIYQRYSVIFPLLSFLVLCLIYIAKQTTRFVNNYEH
ncbi:hypothetical protein [Psychroserpens mesophilus]|uniref:hypothetical protein n=1 Tax=Psychroserpens mesophilus TaxID=325473 RepID=UPI00058AF3D4|nr:hypothetical protein [Psychroserpens mesophilus]